MNDTITIFVDDETWNDVIEMQAEGAPPTTRIGDALILNGFTLDDLGCVTISFAKRL